MLAINQLIKNKWGFISILTISLPRFHLNLIKIGIDNFKIFHGIMIKYTYF